MVTPLFSESPTPMWVVDSNTEIIAVNDSAVDFYGYKREEFLKKNFHDLIPEAQLVSNLEDAPPDVNMFDQVSIIDHQDSSGNVFLVKVISTSFEDGQAHLIKAIPVDLEDENKRVIDKAEQEIKYHLDNSPLAYIIWDESFAVQKVSSKITDWLGYTKKELVNEKAIKLAYELLVHEDFIDAKGKIEALQEGVETSNQHDTRVYSSDGSIKNIKFYNSALLDSEGNLVSVLSLLENKTCKKKLVKSRNEKYKIIQNGLDCIGYFDTYGHIKYLNQSGLDMFGFPQDKESKLTQDVVPDETQEKWQNKICSQVVNKGYWRGELILQKVNGELFPVSAVILAHRNNFGRIEYFSTISRDISEQKGYQKRIQAQNQKLQLAMEGGDIGFWQYSPLRKKLEIDKNWLSDKSGYSPDYLEGKDTLANLIHPDDLDRVKNQFWDTINGRSDTFEEELRIRKKNGSYRWILSKAKVVERSESGKAKKFSGIHIDIDNQKRLKKKNEQYQYIAQNSTLRISVYSSDLNCIYTSPSTENLLGYKPQEFKNQFVFDLIHPDDRSLVENNYQNIKKRNFKERVIYRLKHKKGHYVWVETTVNPVYDRKGSLEEIHTTSRDISNQIKYKKKLNKESKQKQKILNTIPGFCYMLDENRNFVEVTDKFVEELGYSREELKEMNPLDFHYPEDRERINNLVKKAYTTEELSFVEKLVRKDGTDVWFKITCTNFKQDGRKFILGTGIDITKRINAEQMLSYKNELLSKLYEESPLSIVTINKDGDILNVNEQFQETFQYTKQEAFGNNIDELITPPELSIKQKELIEKQRQGDDSFQYESIRLRKDDKEVPVLVGTVPIQVSDRDTISYVLYVDISERKNYMEKLKKSLKEKRVLLQEVHHRVKNNLALVTSFLQLKKFATDDEKLKKMLAESEMQVQTIANIHKKLYETESLTEINVKEYAEDLIEKIRRLNPEVKSKVSLNLDCDNFVLNVNQCIPFGLILNEIISNSYEHGFEKKKQGKINVSVKKKSSKVIAKISDNGVGISDFEETKQKSMGFQIIDALVAQLEGSLNVKNENGMTVIISFEKKNIKGSSSLFRNEERG